MSLQVGEVQRTMVIDTRGLRCPGPTLKLTSTFFKMKPGDRVEMVADCDQFEEDIRQWCVRNHKLLLWVRPEPNKVKRCLIQF